jgi:hypothetical protein
LHSEELYDLYFPSNIIRVIKSSEMRWAGHGACIKEKKMHTEFWCRNVKERGQFEDLA